MVKKILGLDLGSNSVGWALLEEKNGKANKIIDIGSRIFSKAVEENPPTPKNQKRRQMRLGRRVLQRRAKRKQRMLNYLVSLDVLPKELQGNIQPEKLLNEIGNPYELRAKALDERLSPHQLGRVLLHFVARRGFLSSKKQAAGDLVDDPDTILYLQELEKEKYERLAAKSKNKKKLEADDQTEDAFFTAIAGVRQAIEENRCRTLGEYLHNLEAGKCQRNRLHEGGHLRTDRAMYQEELDKIWQKQVSYFSHLPDDFMEDNKGVKRIIFYQRPLKLKKDRVGKCSLEPKNYRASTARLEAQRFRYLLDINHLGYSEKYSGERVALNDVQKERLVDYFECHLKITKAKLIKELNLDKRVEINLEEKNLKGNITACIIRDVIGKQWDEMNDDKQKALFEDLLSIKKKSALKARLINHWSFDSPTATRLCLLEFEPGHSNHSLKAINKLLPHLEKGMIYSNARQAAGYGYESENIQPQKNLSAPPETSNPIVNKGLHELRRVVNAVIKQYGKPDAIRIEMARDLEMNTKRYKENQKRQKENQKSNEEAQEIFAKMNPGRTYASRDEKIKYRLWKEQKECCVYSGKSICLAQVFSADTEIDHILPYRKSLDDSYMNKVICFTAMNREKSDRTPIDSWGGNEYKWNQITQAIGRWDKSLKSKVARFYQTEDDLQKRDFIESQLNDTRYISRLAQEYVRQLGCDVSVTKGFVVSEIRHQWGFNSLIGETNKKERTDHRHHAVDAVVIAATSRSLYTKAVKQISNNKLSIAPPYNDIRNELEENIKHIIVSHAPQQKLSGALHEATGAGYIEKHGGLVYRKTLDSKFTDKNAGSIVDKTVQSIILEHIENYKTSKDAFADGIKVYHKDGKTPIKRVRVLQSKTTEKKLAQGKFGVKDKSGKVFKWMVYGNTHHVEIIRHKETGKIKSEFVTMMEAHRRAMTGTKSAKKRDVVKENIILTNHGNDHEFLMALHIDDTVSVENEMGERTFYRVQKLGGGYDLTLRLHTAATLKNKNEEFAISINKDNFNKHKFQLHRINAIGHLIND